MLIAPVFHAAAPIRASGEPDEVAARRCPHDPPWQKQSDQVESFDALKGLFECARSATARSAFATSFMDRSAK
jgi:hypothetical protein